MWGRKSKTVSVGFGDLNYGFVLPLEGEGISNTGMDRAFSGASAVKLNDGSRDVQLGDGSPTGHHVIMSVFAPGTVAVLLGSEPREIDGVILGYASPQSPFWEKVVSVMNQGGSQTVVGIPGIARRNADGTVGVYVITG